MISLVELDELEVLDELDLFGTSIVYLSILYRELTHLIHGTTSWGVEGERELIDIGIQLASMIGK